MSLRNGLSLGPDEAKKLVQTLTDGVESIFALEEGTLSFVALYRCAYKLVTNQKGDVLYEAVSKTIETHIHQNVKKKLQANQEEEEDFLLFAYLEEWKTFHKCMSSIKDVLMYMDRAYCTGKKITPIFPKGLTLFYQCICADEIWWSKVENKLLDEIQKHRIRLQSQKNETVSQILLSMLTIDAEVSAEKPLGIRFREKMSAQAILHHAAAAKAAEETVDKKTFVSKALDAIEFEKQLAQDLLGDVEAWDSLVDFAEKEWGQNMFQKVAFDPNFGVEALLLEGDICHLQKLRDLYNKWPETFELFSDALYDSIINQGDVILDKTKDLGVVKFVDELRSYFFRTNTLFTETFDSRELDKLLKKAQGIIINSKQSDFAKLLVMYVDDLLSKNSLGLTEMDVESRLSDFIYLFRLLADKDYFGAFYQEFLAKRLLNIGRPPNTTLETEVVKLLNKECGHAFTSRIERMFRDLRYSEDARIRFGRSMPIRVHTGEFKPTVLTMGTWPFPKGPPSSVSLIPNVFSEQVELFTKFYEKEFDGRELKWNLSLGHADVSFKLQSKSWTLICSTYQMMILCLFNSQKSFSFEGIQEQTGIPTDELRLHLGGLHANQQTKVLIRQSSEGKEIKFLRERVGDTYFVNQDFDHKSLRIKLRLPVQKKEEGSIPTKDDNENLQSKIEEERRNLIDSTLIRLMKANKTMKHQEMLNAAIEDLTSKFVISQKAVKSRIDSLIEREYLRRDSIEQDVYLYQS